MDEATPGWLFDGTVATRHDVNVRVAGGQIEIEGAQRIVEQIDPALIVPIADAAQTVFGRKGRAGWRLGFDTPPAGDLAALLPTPARYGSWIDRLGLWKAGAILAPLSAAVVAFILTLPSWIGPWIPFPVERAIGDAMVGDLGGRFCKAGPGTAALAKLAKRIDPGGLPVTVRVVNVNMVNAVALPGGTILIFNGLLRGAQSPDEVAGVLGHEMGHVRNRDAMQSLVRQLGLSVILGGFNGNVGNNMNALLSASYSRGAEAAADGYSIRALRHAQVSPRGTAAFFDRLSKYDVPGATDEAFSYLQSHPASKTRAAAFASSTIPSVAYRPTLSAGEWTSLTRICRDDPARRRDKDLSIF